MGPCAVAARVVKLNKHNVVINPQHGRGGANHDAIHRAVYDVGLSLYDIHAVSLHPSERKRNIQPGGMFSTPVGVKGI